MSTGRPGGAALSYAVVLAVFFASGFSALVYQVVWVEMLDKVFGVTTFAASVVLGAYFGGLALGGYLGGRLGTPGHALRVYGLLEIAIGATALVIPSLLIRVNEMYGALYPYLGDRQALLMPARFVLSLAAMGVPVTLIGAALPVLVRALARRHDEIAFRLPRLYGWNTFGSVLGALLTGYVLIGLLGLRYTTYVAVGVNVAAGLVALATAHLLSRSGRENERGTGGAVAMAPGDAAWRRAALAITFCSGFAALGYEVAWFRVLGLMSDHRAHTFSAIVAIVLLGIGAGSLVMVRVNRRPHDVSSPLAAVLLGLGITGLAWLPIITALSAGIAAVAAIFFQVPERSGTPFAVALAVTFVPCLLMGMSFPLAVQLYARRSHQIGLDVGRMYAVNLVGAMCGSISTGFVLLPLFGAQRTLIALSVVFFAAALLIHARHGDRRRAFRIVGVAGCVAIVALVTSHRMLDALFVRVHPQARVVESHEDIEATVTLAQVDSRRVMYINGAHQADDAPWTIMVHRLLGLIPCLVHGDIQQALVIGMGGGTTAGAISRCADRTTIVEISPGVVRAARGFGSHNRNIAEPAAAEVIIADGRNHLLVADRRYDVMTADTIRPVHAQSGNLYSHDYYRLMTTRLNENGVVLQWIDLSLRTHEELILMRTFASAFPHVMMSELAGSRFLLGSNEPISLDRDVMRERLTPDVLDHLMQAGVAGAEAFLTSFSLGDEALRAAIGAGPVVTDDRPINEYFNLLRIGNLWRLLPERSAEYRPRS